MWQGKSIDLSFKPNENHSNPAKWQTIKVSRFYYAFKIIKKILFIWCAICEICEHWCILALNFLFFIRHMREKCIDSKPFIFIIRIQFSDTLCHLHLFLGFLFSCYTAILNTYCVYCTHGRVNSIFVAYAFNASHWTGNLRTKHVECRWNRQREKRNRQFASAIFLFFSSSLGFFKGPYTDI